MCCTGNDKHDDDHDYNNNVDVHTDDHADNNNVDVHTDDHADDINVDVHTDDHADDINVDDPCQSDLNHRWRFDDSATDRSPHNHIAASRSNNGGADCDLSC